MKWASYFPETISRHAKRDPKRVGCQAPSLHLLENGGGSSSLFLIDKGGGDIQNQT